MWSHSKPVSERTHAQPSPRLGLLNLLSQFLSVRRNFPSPFSGRMTSPNVCLEAWALHGTLAGWQCQERAVQTQPSLIPAQPETRSARPERNQDSPKRSRKTARHQAGHTAQGTEPPNTSGRWGRTSLLVLGTEQSRRMYRMLSLNNKWQVSSSWLSCPSHLSSVYRKEVLVLSMETQCHSNSRSLLLLLTRGNSGSANRDKVSKNVIHFFVIGQFLLTLMKAIYIMTT